MDDFVNPDKSGGAGSAKTGDAAVIFLKQLRKDGPWMLLAIAPEGGVIEAKTVKTSDEIRGFVAMHILTRQIISSDFLRTALGSLGEKPNHCVVLAGPPGVGKDALLEPLKYAVGPWNFREIAAGDVMSAHNDFMKSVVLSRQLVFLAGVLDDGALGY